MGFVDILKEQCPRGLLAKNEHFRANCLWDRSPVMLRKLLTNFFWVNSKKIQNILTNPMIDIITLVPYETQKQMKRIKIHQLQTMTFWTCSSKCLFLRRSAEMIDATEKSKISSNNKNNPWWVVIAFSSDCSKFHYCWLWFRPAQTLSKHFSAWFTCTQMHDSLKYIL